MALIAELEVEPGEECQSLVFIEATGAYVLATNPGGYGADTLASSAVTSFELSVYLSGYTVPILITGTVVSNVITQIVITYPDATTDTLTGSELPQTVFPFSTGNTLEMSSLLLFKSEDTDLTDGVIKTEYTVTNGVTEYATSCDILSSCQACCCVADAHVALRKDDINDNKDKVMAAIFASTWVKAAQYSADCDMEEQANVNVAFALELCTGGCANC